MLLIWPQDSSPNSDEREEFTRFCRFAVQQKLALSGRGELRLIWRDQAQGAAIEAYIGQQTLDDALSEREARSVLQTLVECTFSLSACVDVIRSENGDTRAAPDDISLDDFALLVELEQGRAWRVARAPDYFHFSRVEAQLDQPLRMDEQHTATHYFQEFVIRASNVDRAHDYVRYLVERDAARIVDFGEIELLGTADPSDLDAEIEHGGKIYFTE